MAADDVDRITDAILAADAIVVISRDPDDRDRVEAALVLFEKDDPVDLAQIMRTLRRLIAASEADSGSGLISQTP